MIHKSNSSPRLAFIGLGNMGRGMCLNIVRKANLEHPLIVYDISEQCLGQVHGELGTAVRAASVAEAASQAQIIFFSVPNDNAALSVTEEILSAGVPGKVVVDCSTTHPDTTDELARRVAQGGGSFVACPVFGVQAIAEAGQLICVLAGPAEAVEQVKPFCAGVMGRANIDLAGENPSQATRLKIIGNSFVLNMVEALSEGHVVAEKSGLGSGNLHKFIELMFPGPYAAYSTRMMTGDYYKRERPLCSVDIARKDARYAQGIAQKAGMHMKNVELADSYLKVVQDIKGSVGELVAMYGAKRVEAGLSFEN